MVGDLTIPLTCESSQNGFFKTFAEYLNENVRVVCKFGAATLSLTAMLCIERR
jgi:hypothetical protein